MDNKVITSVLGLLVVFSILAGCAAGNLPSAKVIRGTLTMRLDGFEVQLVTISPSSAKKLAQSYLGDDAPRNVQAIWYKCLTHAYRVSVTSSRKRLVGSEGIVRFDTAAPAPMRLVEPSYHPSLIVGLVRSGLRILNIGDTRLKIRTKGRVFVAEVPSKISAYTAHLVAHETDGSSEALPPFSPEPC